MRERTLRVLASALAIGVVAGCHDEFPDRLKKGCNSGNECTLLVADAADRLNECIGHIVPGKFETNYGRLARRHCHYEYADAQVAVEKANQWAKWSHASGYFSIDRPYASSPHAR